MDKRKQDAIVIRQEEVAPDIFSMWLKTDVALQAKPGQFVNIFSRDNAHLLGRPISICEIDREDSALRFVYQKKGFGTTEFSACTSGNLISIMGPLGNGFPLYTGHSLLIGGGMGVAPLLGLSEALPGTKTAVLGYRDGTFLTEEFEKSGAKVVIATESGSHGIMGNVLDAIKSEGISAPRVYVCGPRPMIRAVAEYFKDAETYVSLEEKMACGIGACLGCVTPAAEANEHYRVEKLCVCKDGPVFNAKEVVL